MGDFFTDNPLKLKEEFRLEKLEENYTVLKILPFVIMFSSVLYLLQYQYLPGIESESEFRINYLFLFYFSLSISIIFRVFLPLFMKIKSMEIKENINMIYLVSMFLFCIILTAFDLQLSADFSAYAVGLLSLAFLIRTSWWRYLFLTSGGFVIFSVSYFLIADSVLPINETLPILVFTIVATYITYSREQAKKQLFMLKHKLRESAVKDPLTNLYNRRYMVEFLAKQFAFYKRYETKTSILILDIDFFKSINDKLGHIVGDSVLKDFSRLILNEIRDTDLACRYGGEEFVVILSNADKTDAQYIAERIRATIEKHNFKSVNWTITVSIGISGIEADDTEISILERADSNLYTAKKSGRNKVV